MSSEWISSKSPAFAGGVLGMMAGLAAFGFGCLGLFGPESTMPLPQAIALVVAGLIDWSSCFFALKRVRLAWAFALSLNGTAVLVFIFGAPKVRDAWHTNMGVGYLPAIIFLSITVLLAISSEEYG